MFFDMINLVFQNPKSAANYFFYFTKKDVMNDMVNMVTLIYEFWIVFQNPEN